MTPGEPEPQHRHYSGHTPLASLPRTYEYIVTGISLSSTLGLTQSPKLSKDVQIRDQMQNALIGHLNAFRQIENVPEYRRPSGTTPGERSRSGALNRPKIAINDTTISSCRVRHLEQWLEGSKDGLQFPLSADILDPPSTDCRFCT